MHKSDIELGLRCDEDWQRMEGDERVRRCERCKHDVHDLSAGTRAQARRLLGSATPPCVRFRADGQGRIVFRPSPGARLLHWAATLLVGWSWPAWAEPPGPATVESTFVASEPYVGSLHILVLDAENDEAPLEGAEVLVASTQDDRGEVLVTNGAGEVTIEGLAVGTYEVRLNAPGFQVAVVTGVTVSNRRTTQQRVALRDAHVDEMGMLIVGRPRPGWRIRNFFRRIF